MEKMGKFRIRAGVVLVVTLLGLVAVCVGDKDPSISLRPPASSGPVFSSSIDTIPVVNSASTNQQSVYIKRPSSVHSSASSSVSSSSSSSNDQVASGGRNNNPWYAGGGSGFGFDFNGASNSEGSSAGSSSLSSSSASNGGFYEHSPSQSSSSSNPGDSYSPTNAGGQPAYTYFYQHYPTSGGSGHGWSGGDDNGGIFGDLSLPSLQIPGLGGAGGGGLAGLGGVGALKVVKAIAKGILVVKPFLILGLLLLIALPVLFLLLPIPIITITGQPSVLRSARSSQIASYLTQLSGKVLNAEECLERVICKLPQAPEKYQSRAKLMWDEYGTKMVKNERVSRGLNAYFENPSQKNKNLTCNQRFKCSNKYL